jgi:transposase-like protein
VLQLSATADWQGKNGKVRPVIFRRWRQFELAIIVASVNCYLRYSLSLRDVEELLIERGVSADHTVWRCVQEVRA